MCTTHRSICEYLIFHSRLKETLTPEFIELQKVYHRKFSQDTTKYFARLIAFIVIVVYHMDDLIWHNDYTVIIKRSGENTLGAVLALGGRKK